MSFFSTRGGSCVTASQAILRSATRDGGLFVPAMFPMVEIGEITAFSNKSYAERTSEILKMYLEDFSPEEISGITKTAYESGRFDDPSVAPMRRLDRMTWVMELFHGPTAAFKDIALQLLPYLLRIAAEKNSETGELTVLMATTGDTGKAAMEGFRDIPGTRCAVFYPQKGIGEVQRLQMETAEGSNIHAIAVDATFDEIQNHVRDLLSSEDFASKLAKKGCVLTSANSINFGRIAAQIVYYFSAYADLIANGEIVAGEQVNFVVPTGNFGNILAAYYAGNMGLPIHRLICASNRNKVLTDFFSSGIYSVHRTFFKTKSPSMDILFSSNLERLLYEASDRDGALVSAWMGQLKECGSFSVGEQRKEWLDGTFCSGCADDRETLKEIRDRFEQDHYLMDPHTAVASHVLRRYRQETSDDKPSIIVATASPYKFSEDVLLGLEGSDAIKGKDAFECASKLAEISGMKVPERLVKLQNMPVRQKAVCETDGIMDTVLQLL